MKKIKSVNYLFTLFFVIVQVQLFAQNRYWISDVASDWSGNNWANTSNGAADGVGPPTAVQNAIFDVNGTGNCLFDVVSATVNSITFSTYTAILDLNGGDLEVSSGSFILSSGTIADNLGGANIFLNNASSADFNGGSVDARISGKIQSLDFDGTRFLKSCFFEKSGTANDFGSGGNYFADTLSINYSTGSGYIIFGQTDPDTLNGYVNFVNSSSGYIEFGRNTIGNFVNDLMEVSSTGSSNGIRFGTAGGTTTFSASADLQIGSNGFTTSDLNLNRINFLNPSVIDLATSSGARILVNDCYFNSDLSLTAGGLQFQNNEVVGVASLTKTGSSSENSSGGNKFHQNLELISTGSGNFGFGNGLADSCLANVVMQNSINGALTFAYGGADHYIAGNLTVENLSAAASSHAIYIARSATSSLVVDGNASFLNTGNGSDSRIFIGEQGDIVFNGEVMITNDIDATVGWVLVANNPVSQVIFNARTESLNSGAGTNNRIYFGNQGEVIANDSLFFSNTSTASNSQFYVSNNDTSYFNAPITIQSSSTSSSALTFGESGGTVFLGPAVEFIADNFNSGRLIFESVIQTAPTAQTLVLGSQADFYIERCNFGGSFSIVAPDIHTRQTRYGADLNLHRTSVGTNSENQYGGNVVLGNTTLITAASGYWLWANTQADSFYQNLTIIDSSSSSFYLAYNADSFYIGGNLLLEKYCTGTTTTTFIADNVSSEITIDGDVSVEVYSTSTDENVSIGQQGTVIIGGNVSVLQNGSNAEAYFANGSFSNVQIGGDFDYQIDNTGSFKRLLLANNGALTIQGKLNINNATTIDNSEVLLAAGSSSSIQIDGVLTAINSGSGSTRQVRFCENGACIFNDSIYVTNTSDASSSFVYFNRASNAVAQYNGSITIEATGANCDGVYFGNGNGVATMSAGNSIYFGPLGFDASNFEISNFTQLGSVMVDLHPNTNTNFYIANSDFGGVVDISAPRVRVTGSNFQDQFTAEKTGASNDYWYGNNHFLGDAFITSSGTDYLVLSANNPDTFLMDLTLNHLGSSNVYLGQSSGSAYIAGDLFLNYSGNALNSTMLIANDVASVVVVDGSFVATNTTTSNNHNFFIGNSGLLTVGGDLLVANLAQGDNSNVTIANNVNSSVSVGGKVKLIQNPISTNYSIFYVGDQGDVTIGDSLIILNQTLTANNNQVRCAFEDSSALVLNGPVLFENPDANGSGITFGQSGGTTTLAVGNPLEITSNGFAAGLLYLYQFTQLGSEAITLNTTGTTDFFVSNSLFNGAVDFTGPQFRTEYTRYNSSVILEKTAGTDDNSRGNYFAGNTIITHSGDNNFFFGVAAADSFMLDLVATNTSTDEMQFALSSADNYVGGIAQFNHLASGTSADLSVAFNSGSSMLFNDDATFIYNSTANNNINYLGYNGDLVFNQNLSISNNSLSSSEVNVATTIESSVSVAGVLRIETTGAGNSTQVIFGNQGDVILGDSVYLLNGSSATNSLIRIGEDDSSTVTIAGDIVIESSVAGCDGIYFGNSGGNLTLAAGQKIVVGSNGFVSGSLYIENFTQVGPTDQTITATGDTYFYLTNDNWGGNVDFSAPRIRSDYSTFNGTSFFEKTGASDDRWLGGNVFTDSTSIVNTGTDHIMTAINDADTFLSHLSLINQSSEAIYLVDDTPGNYIAGNLWVENNGVGSTSLVNACQSAGSELTIDGSVFIQNIGTATNSNLSFPRLGPLTVGGQFSLTSDAADRAEVIIAEGTASSLTVSGVTTIINNGNSNLNRIYLGSSGDIVLNDSLHLLNRSSANTSHILCANSSNSSLQLNGHVMLESSEPNCDGIYFGNGAGTTTLSSPFSMNINANGFSEGLLYFRNFSQLGANPHAFVLTANADCELYEADWGGNVSFTSPRFRMRDSDFSGDLFVEKTGATDDNSNGNNNITGNLTMNNSGSGYLRMASSISDSILGNAIVSITGTDHVYLAAADAGNYIGGDLMVDHASTAGTSYFILADNTNSSLQIDGNFTYSNTSSGSDQRLYFGNNGDVTLGGDFDYSNTATSTNTYLYLAIGSLSDVVINGITNVVHHPTGPNTHFVFFGNSGNVTANGNVTLSNNSSANNNNLSVCQNASSTVIFNGDVQLESYNAQSDGISFGTNAGSVILTLGNQFSVGPNGFSSGTLYFRNVSSLTTLSQSLSLSGSSLFNSLSSLYNADFSVVAPRLYANQNSFNGATVLQKTGAGNDNSTGGNTYNDDVTFINTGSGYFMQASSTADDFNGNVTYQCNSGSLMYPSYNAASTYAGNISMDLDQNTSFGTVNGTIIFDGNAAQTVNDLGSTGAVSFRRIRFNKSADTVTLNTPIQVTVSSIFTSGVLKTDNTNYLEMTDNSSVSGANNTSFVRGPVLKIGNDAFTFPVGDSLYRPISISAPSSTGAQYMATYFYDNPAPTYDYGSKDAPINNVSTREYWILNSVGVSSPVNVTLSWDENSGGVGDLTKLLVARWDGDSWTSHGNGGTTGNMSAGTVRTSAAVSSFSPFTIASSDAANPLPIELISFDAIAEDDVVNLTWQTATEINNDYFEIERSANGVDFEFVTKTMGAGNSNTILNYQAVDNAPLNGISYYRLKQVDFDGTTTYSELKLVNRISDLDINISVFESVITINYGEAADRYAVSLFDMEGRMVYDNQDDVIANQTVQHQLSSKLASGIYLLRITGQNSQFSTRLFIP